MALQPGNVFVAGHVGILAVDTLAGPVGHPVRRVAQELRGAEGVRQKNQQLALVTLLPQLQQTVLRGAQLLVVAGQRGHGHGQLVAIGADGFKIVLVSEVTHWRFR